VTVREWLMVPLCALGVAGCDRAVKAGLSDARPEASSTVIAEPPESAPPVTIADAASIEAGPAERDAGVSTEARERAVLELLAGGEPATRLPRAGVDPGHDFDPAQRDRVAPPMRPPLVKKGTMTVAGPLPEEVIERIVRQNFGRWRLCYENGLRTNPELAGQIVVRFAIDKTGAVEGAKSPSATLDDPNVVACAVRSFGNLSFPEQEKKGTVHVMYTLLFEPGDSP
jgi:hypothetical protein